jgi:CBS-domain-containing membrane protein
MLARDIMTSRVVTIRPEAGVHEAARLLAEHNISGVPVVDAAGAMVGLVTEADLIGKPGETVGDIMSRRVMSVGEGTPVDEIAQLLTSNHYKRVPIVRGDKVVGVVSRADIVKMMASRWVCETCGAVQHGRRPARCFDCGVDGGRFERELDPRPEISTRQ